MIESLQWSKKETVSLEEGCGTYFIRSSLTGVSEELLWQFYNTIREIEATFRCLKTDLDLRPVYHKTDNNVLDHLHLGILAYWMVNTVRYQLKREKINSSWREIVRIMNTQKVETTTAQNIHDEIIILRRCSEISQEVKRMYDALKYKYAPFTKRKSVVHKSEF